MHIDPTTLVNRTIVIGKISAYGPHCRDGRTIVIRAIVYTQRLEWIIMPVVVVSVALQRINPFRHQAG